MLFKLKKIKNFNFQKNVLVSKIKKKTKTKEGSDEDLNNNLPGHWGWQTSS